MTYKLASDKGAPIEARNINDVGRTERTELRNSGRQSAREVSGLPPAEQQDQLCREKRPPAARGQPAARASSTT